MAKGRIKLGLNRSEVEMGRPQRQNLSLSRKKGPSQTCVRGGLQRFVLTGRRVGGRSRSGEFAHAFFFMVGSMMVRLVK